METNKKVKVVQDAKILIPNPAHNNFTDSGQFIPEGTQLEGKYVIIKGLRRGEPFQYKLFKVANSNQFIYQKTTKPVEIMENTEVKLGVGGEKTSGAQESTIVKVPSNAAANRTPIITAVLGAMLGYGVARWRKVEGNMKWVMVGAGAAIGYIGGNMYVTRKKVTVTKGK